MSKLSLAAALALLAFPPLARADFVPANFDPTVKPQDDFYRYANGSWLKQAKIPAAYPRWGAFDELNERNEESLRVLCERATAQSDQVTPAEQMVGDFYASAMDEGASNQAGFAPLQFELERLDGLKSPADVLAELAHFNALGVPAGFVFDSTPDYENSAMEIAEVRQAGLGLPDRDYYFRTDEKSVKLRQQYVAHIARMLRLIGESAATAEAGAKAVMKLETALAAGSLSPVQLRDPHASCHKMSLAGAAKAAPGIDWRAYFAKTEAPAFTELNLAHPEFFKAVAAALAGISVADWQSYLRWQFIHAYAPYLSNDFVGANFDFYGVTLTGTKALKARWKRAVRAIDGSVGEALGQLYVAAYFPPEAKARVLQLVGNLRSALRARLETLAWMDEPTRAKALAKLDAITVKIGYPDRWRDYRSLVIDRGPYVLNVLKAGAFEARRNLKKIGTPVDRGEWEMTPPTVNAYYDPSHNEIVFPAGILQRPFFDAEADDAVNYGAIGAVIGHEMTHGFDDEGRQFDLRGNLTDWWTPESATRFNQRAAGIVRQFGAYAPFPDLHLNGELTEGENIADLGGVKLAYAALEKALGDRPRDRVAGFTPEQRFFLSYASNWRVRYRPEALRLQINTNPHSPGEFRCNGPLSNLEEFAAAFEVPAGAPMRRSATERVEIW